MIIPSFLCSKCGRKNPTAKPNLRMSQGASENNEGMSAIIFDIRSVSRECSCCGKQKILRVEE